jgi:hypothetical protein
MLSCGMISRLRLTAYQLKKRYHNTTSYAYDINWQQLITETNNPNADIRQENKELTKSAAR